MPERDANGPVSVVGVGRMAGEVVSLDTVPFVDRAAFLVSLLASLNVALFVFNLVIGMLTPPVGVVLFVICGLSGLKLGELAKHVWPFIAVMYGLLLLCMFVPQIVLTVPRALGY